MEMHIHCSRPASGGDAGWLQTCRIITGPDRLEKNRGPFGTYWWVNVQEKANEPPISLSLSATGGLLSDRKYWAVKRRRERDTELYWASKK